MDSRRQQGSFRLLTALLIGVNSSSNKGGGSECVGKKKLGLCLLRRGKRICWWIWTTCRWQRMMSLPEQLDEWNSLYGNDCGEMQFVVENWEFYFVHRRLELPTWHLSERINEDRVSVVLILSQTLHVTQKACLKPSGDISQTVHQTPFPDLKALCYLFFLGF